VAAGVALPQAASNMGMTIKSNMAILLMIYFSFQNLMMLLHSPLPQIEDSNQSLIQDKHLI
jgi:hypothetical protein